MKSKVLSYFLAASVLFVSLAGGAPVLTISAKESQTVSEAEGNDDSSETPSEGEGGSSEGESTGEEGTETQEPEKPVKNGLVKEGKNYYYYKNGVKQKNCFKTVKKKRYYFGANGRAKKGWFKKGKYYYYGNKKNAALKKSCVVEGYKINKKYRCATKFQIKKLVSKTTKSGMSKKQKVQAIFNWLTTNSWKYIRTYEHSQPGWKWYKGWADDYAARLIKKKGGNCFAYAAVFSFMVSEATGYKARVHHGSTPGAHAPTVPHGWSTVMIGGKWIAFDPDMAKFHGRKPIYYWQPYSSTRRSIHLGGGYEKLY